MRKFLFFLLSSFTLCVANAQNKGIYINGSQTIPEKVHAALQLGAEYVRMPFTLTQPFQPQLWKIRQFTDAGFKIALTVNYDSTSDFPTDTIYYKQLLTSLLVLYKPDYLFVENEPTNYKPQPFANYLNELAAAATVCNKHKVICSDGGMTYHPLEILALNKRTFLNSKLRIRANYDTATMALEAKLNITPNFHDYDTTYITAIINYIFSITGKMPVSNELGSYTTSPQVYETELKLCAGLDLAILISSSERGKAKAFIDNTGNIINGFQNILK